MSKAKHRAKRQSTFLNWHDLRHRIYLRYIAIRYIKRGKRR
jgi:hypothetical protein